MFFEETSIRKKIRMKEKTMSTTETKSRLTTSIVTILGGRLVGASSLIISKLIPEYRRLHTDSPIILFSECVADRELYRDQGKLLEKFMYEDLDSKVLDSVTTVSAQPMLIIFETSRNYNTVYNTVKFQSLLRNHTRLNISMIFVLDIEDFKKPKEHKNYQTTWKIVHDIAFVRSEIIYFFLMPPEIAERMKKFSKSDKIEFPKESFIYAIYKR